jgi:putative transposase
VTSVTHGRTPLLIEHFSLFWEAVERSKDRSHIEVIAWVVLPEHFHMIIDPKGEELSGVLRRMKLSFANQFYREGGEVGGRIWQPRFWDHIIRDQEDMNRHIDYIHYNPVKHGHTANHHQWGYSSLGKYLKDGYYSADWGVNERLHFSGGYGE